MTKRYSDEQMIAAIKSSFSIRQTLLKLGLVAAGAGYKTFHRFVKKHNIDTSHFTGQSISKGQIIGPKRLIEVYLNNEFLIGSNALKRRLLRENIFQPICSSCNLTHWQTKLIPLELDHIDGNNENNNLSNLRLLCPNCHAQTPTYRGKNKAINNTKLLNFVNKNLISDKSKEQKTILPKNRIGKLCKLCFTELKNEKFNYCGNCWTTRRKQIQLIEPTPPRKTKIEWPSNEELLKRLEHLSYSALGRELGVSDNAIRKRLHNH